MQPIIKKIKIAVWLGFDRRINISREGVGRYIEYFVKHLAKSDNYEVEIWLNSYNAKNLYAKYADLANVKIITEQARIFGKFIAFLNLTPLFYHYFFGTNQFSWRVPYLEYKDNAEVKVTFFDHIIKVILYVIGLWLRITKTFCFVNNYGQLFLYLFFYVILFFVTDSVINNPDYARLVSYIYLFKSIALTVIILISVSAFITLISKLIEIFVKPGKLYSYLLINSANKHSTADIFFVPIFTIDHGLEIKRRKVLAALDIFPCIYRFEFVTKYKEYNNQDLDLMINVLNQYAEQGTQFVCNSEYVRDTHFLHFVEKLKKENTSVIYLPANIPHKIKAINKATLLNNFGIKGKFIFYPTQIRPHKNLLVLLKALDILIREDHQDVKLVLTGNVDNYYDIKNYIDTHNLRDYIYMLNELSEDELYNMYKFADLTVVTTKDEAGFPWQILEAVFMETPVITTKIPVLIERLKFHNINPDKSGLILFDVDDFQALAKHILYVLQNRQNVVKGQFPMKAMLSNYSWDDTINEFNHLFIKLIDNNT